MLLIYPPLAKPCEPPAGIAGLAGALKAQGVGYTLLDANLEAQLHLLGQPISAGDTWSRRAARNREANLAALRQPATYGQPDRYRRAVADLNRLLNRLGQEKGLDLSLANYQDPSRSPLASADLLAAADNPGANIFYPYFSQRLPERIEAEQPTLVGISINYLSQALTGFAMLGFLKEKYPQLPLVVGGGLITSWLRNPGFRNPFGGLIDQMVAGPGEGPLLARLGRSATTPTPGPDYSGLPLTDYLSPGLILPYAASSGCYWKKCAFCPETAEHNPYAVRPVKTVQADLKKLVRRHRPALIHFLDNAVPPPLLGALADEPPGPPWYGFTRIGEELADIDFCRKLRASGCVMLKLGLESGDQGVLDAMHKGIDLELASRVLTALQTAGIATYVYLLFGTPHETEAAARSTMEFVVRHAAAITFVNLAIFNMPLGSPEATSLGLQPFSDSDLSLYTDFTHPHGWDRQAIRRFLDHEFKRQPAILPILHRDPPLFTSNHAPFFV